MKHVRRHFRLLIGALVLAVSPVLMVDVSKDRSPEVANGPFDRIDRYVRDQMDDAHIPGVAIAIIDGGHIVHAQGFGNDGHGQQITPQTPFWIGSNTKSFTTLAAMQLAEVGVIDLDAPVQRYLPDFTTADPEAASRITVRHLMNQTSGFSRAAGIALVLEEKVQTLEEAVADLRTITLNRPVGESYEYSNLNFVVLGLIVQTVSGEPWATYIETRIFAPLKMENSFTSLEDARAHGLSTIHRYWFGIPVGTEGTYLPGMAPTGWLYASAEDMARYLSMYLQGGTSNGAPVLSEEGIHQMLEPATNITTRPLMSHEFTFRYGRGWFVGEFGAAADARWHLGNLPSFTAWMVLLPETNQAVVVLINAGSQFEIAGANEVMSRIPLGVVNILLGAPPPTGVSLSRFYVVFDAVVLLWVAIQAWSLVRVWRRPPQRPYRVLAAVAALMPLVWEVGLSLVILAAFPASMGMTWPQSLESVPDLTLVLLVASCLWLSTCIVRAARLIQAVAADRRIDPNVHRAAAMCPPAVRR